MHLKRKLKKSVYSLSHSGYRTDKKPSTIIKRIALALLGILGAASMSGCLAPMNIEENGYVILLGIDEGETSKYSFSFTMQNQSSSSSENTKPEILTVSIEGNNIFHAVAAAEAGLPYALNFSRTSCIIFSLDVAKSDLLREFFISAFSSLRIRESADMLICFDKCADFLEGLKSDESINLAQLQYNLFNYYEKEGMVNICNMTEFLESSRGGRFDAFMPYCSVDKSITTEEEKKSGEGDESDTTRGYKRQGGLKSYWLGSAVFSKFEFKGILDSHDTKLALIGNGRLKNCNMDIEFENKTLTLRLSQTQSNDVKYSVENSTADIKVYLDARIEESTPEELYSDPRDKEELSKKIEETIGEYIVGELGRIFETSLALKSDIMGLGRYASLKFTSVREWEDYNFKEQMCNLKCNFSVDVKLAEFFATSYAG